MYKNKDKNISKLKERGFAVAGEQHNGTLLVRIDNEDVIQRKVIDNFGMIRTYKPREAKEIELQRFKFATGKDVGRKIRRKHKYEAL